MSNYFFKQIPKVSQTCLEEKKRTNVEFTPLIWFTDFLLTTDYNFLV